MELFVYMVCLYVCVSVHVSECVSVCMTVCVLSMCVARRKWQWVALLPHSARDPGLIPGSGHCLCGVCTFSPRVCVGFLRVLRFPPTVQRCAG